MQEVPRRYPESAGQEAAHGFGVMIPPRRHALWSSDHPDHPEVVEMVETGGRRVVEMVEMVEMANSMVRKIDTIGEMEVLKIDEIDMIGGAQDRRDGGLGEGIKTARRRDSKRGILPIAVWATRPQTDSVFLTPWVRRGMMSFAVPATWRMAIRAPVPRESTQAAPVS